MVLTLMCSQLANDRAPRARLAYIQTATRAGKGHPLPRVAVSVYASRVLRAGGSGAEEEACSELLHRGGRAVADEAAADVGGCSAAHERAVGEQRDAGGVRLDRGRRPCRLRRNRRACASSVSRPGSPSSPTTATCSGPRTIASAAVSQWPANRGCLSARMPAARSAASAASRYRAGSATSTDAVSSAEASADAPHGARVVVTSRGRCSSASASSAVSKNEPGCSGSAKCSSAVSSRSAAAASQRGLAGGLVQREQPVGEAAVVLQHAGRGTHDPVARRAPQPPVHQVQPQQQVSGLRGGVHPVGPAERSPRLGEREDRHPVPRRDHLVVAGRLRPRVPAPPAGRRAPAPSAPGRRGRRAAAGWTSRARTCPASVTVSSAAAHFAVLVAEHLAQLLPASRRRSAPRRPRCRRRARRRNRPPAVRRSRSRKAAVSSAIRRGSGSPVTRARCA